MYGILVKFLRTIIVNHHKAYLCTSIGHSVLVALIKLVFVVPNNIDREVVVQLMQYVLVDASTLVVDLVAKFYY